ncbi:hypothetical protein D3Z52_02600 [Clostridiaceae bacterium]|nr:hypothetical protein [Clostridiaceae bacterium]
MNREQRRAFKKKHKKSVREHAADRFNKLSQEIENPLHDGDKVQLDVDRIISRKDYAQTTEEYHSFVESSRDRVFTVRLYRKRKDGFSAIIELVEEPKWLFWYGDLVLVENGG